MIIKCGRNEIEVNENDIIGVNDKGYCWFQTRKTYVNRCGGEPVKVAKAKAVKMIKDGTLVLFKEETGANYYKFNL